MAIQVIHQSSIRGTIEVAIMAQKRFRSMEPALNQFERPGINFSIILNTACYVEGSIEWSINHVLNYIEMVIASIEIPEFGKRRGFFSFWKRVVSELESKMSRATGPENSAEIFKLMTGVSLKECAGEQTTWEGIQALFALRNVIAHGRMASMTSIFHGPDKEDSIIEFKGGYASSIAYLKKRGIDVKKLNETSIEDSLFTDVIADHFFDVAKKFVTSVEEKVVKEIIPAWNVVDPIP